MARNKLHYDEGRGKNNDSQSPVEIYKRSAYTYVFSKDQMMMKFMHNKSFRDAILTGAYFYSEGKIILYNPAVFQISEGNMVLALGSDEKYEQYCISEKNSRVYTPQDRNHQGRKHFRFLRTKVKGTVKAGKDYKKKHLDTGGYVAHTNENKNDKEIIHAKDFVEEFEREYSLAVEKAFLGVKEYIEHGSSGEPDLTFGKLFSKYMDDKGFSTNDLADRTGIDPRTIRRLKKDDDYYGSLDYVVMCCLAMGLSPHESDALLYLGSHVLRKNIKKERAYDTLLHIFYWCESMFDYDLLLCKMELETFTEIIEKEREKHKNK